MEAGGPAAVGGALQEVAPNQSTIDPDQKRENSSLLNNTTVGTYYASDIAKQIVQQVFGGDKAAQLIQLMMLWVLLHMMQFKQEKLNLQKRWVLS